MKLSGVLGGVPLGEGKKDGTTIKVIIGEDAADPVFCISDILPHLAQDQMKDKASDFIKGEDLDLIMGSCLPAKKAATEDSGAKKDKEKDRSKKLVIGRAHV